LDKSTYKNIKCDEHQNSIGFMDLKWTPIN